MKGLGWILKYFREMEIQIKKNSGKIEGRGTTITTMGWVPMGGVSNFSTLGGVYSGVGEKETHTNKCCGNNSGLEFKMFSKNANPVYRKSRGF